MEQPILLPTDVWSRGFAFFRFIRTRHKNDTTEQMLTIVQHRHVPLNTQERAQQNLHLNLASDHAPTGHQRRDHIHYTYSAYRANAPTNISGHAATTTATSERVSMCMLSVCVCACVCRCCVCVCVRVYEYACVHVCFQIGMCECMYDCVYVYTTLRASRNGAATRW